MPNDSTSHRLIIDLSSLARWYGPAVGISRVERIFATWARAHRPHTVFAFYDPLTREFRQIRRQWIDPVLAGDVVVDLWGIPEPSPTRRHKSDRIPTWIRPQAMGVLQLRKQTLVLLERIRLTAKNPRFAELAGRLQMLLMSEKYRRQMITASGKRRSLVPYSTFLGNRLALTSRDILFSAGSGWTSLNIEAIRVLKQRNRFRFVQFCHDIIPIQFPETYKTHDFEEFRNFYRGAFPIADLVIFGAQRIKSDVEAHCRTLGISLRATGVTPFGSDAVRQRTATAAPLRPGIERDRYALLVSTIEPRKGHEMLYRIWKRLLADGIPQTTNIKLIFVGRPGWMVENLLREIAADRDLGGTLQIISFAGDDELATLYANAAFCVYPSLYEGYGLPVVEAFSYGKAVIASTGGAIPEVAGEFSPCLDPKDEESWYRTLRGWIEDPSLRAPYENAIRTRYRPTSWDEASAKLFELIDRHFRQAAR
ncbi:MAG TPA: glycosyltransferase family 1 protein [Xanthobacteraceae bacterium]|jgi:glycosyltransferase involved in cell wall biosynthesis